MTGDKHHEPSAAEIAAACESIQRKRSTRPPRCEVPRTESRLKQRESSSVRHRGRDPVAGDLDYHGDYARD